MSPVVKNHTTMNPYPVMESAIPIGVSTGIPDANGNEHTATGIPVSLLWMPYIGFSFIMIILMFFSFLHYHRKHGHKYHHRQQFWGSELSVASVLGSIQNQVVSIGKGAGNTGDNNPSDGGGSGGGGVIGGTTRTRKDSNIRRDSKDAPRSKGIGYRGVEEYIPPLVVNHPPPPHPPPHNLPPNGGLRINRSKSDVGGNNRTIDLRASHHNPHHHHHHHNPHEGGGGGSHRILPSQPTAQPLSNPQHRPGHRPRPRNPHCDEPSTSSSTVSSKTSNQSTKPGGGSGGGGGGAGGGGRNKRGSHNHRQKRPLGPLVFEANENGSMVDVRVNVKDNAGTIELKPTPKERGPPGNNNINNNPHNPISSMEDISNAQRPNNSYRYSASVEDSYMEPTNSGRRKLPQNYNWTPNVPDNNTYPSSNPHNRGSKYRDTNPDEYSLYEDRNSRSTSLPIWSTMPLCPKPEPPKRDYYSYPFTPSGHMEMLSDTENDEVFLLQHTKL